jgi:hypothetical protein
VVARARAGLSQDHLACRRGRVGRGARLGIRTPSVLPNVNSGDSTATGSGQNRHKTRRNRGSLATPESPGYGFSGLSRRRPRVQVPSTPLILLDFTGEFAASGVLALGGCRISSRKSTATYSACTPFAPTNRPNDANAPGPDSAPKSAGIRTGHLPRAAQSGRGQSRFGHDLRIASANAREGRRRPTGNLCPTRSIAPGLPGQGQRAITRRPGSAGPRTEST